ncbi:MAG: L,D-transpeptidase family protein [Sphingomicrobium sp.]
MTIAAGIASAQTTSTSSVATPSMAAASFDDYSRFYAASKNAPIWFRSGQAEAGPLLVSILRRSTIEGFSRGPQLAADVEAALAKAQAGDPAALQEADRLLSRAWVAYVQAIHAPTPGMLYGEKWVTPVVPTTFAILGKALRAPSLVEHLKSVSDVNPIYRALRDAALTEAKLPDGGNAARYAANLERVRSIPATGKFVLVDAATARLWMYEDGQPVDSMKVIVGDKAKLGLPTPMIASVIWYATFNPYWHVPDHLVKKTLAKHVIEDGEGYLKKNGYEIVSDWNATEILPASSVDWKAAAAGTIHVKIRQLPGPTNSMGKLKFNFANPEGIYLHDTPNKALFAQSNRALSNGCIRLEDAKRLGHWLMGQEPVAPSSAAEQHVTLPAGIPVYVTYLTAQPHLGENRLARDIYGWDARSPITAAVAMQAAGAGS